MRTIRKDTNLDDLNPVLLCILDGWGLRECRTGNAVALARTPNFDNLMRLYPGATLTAHGPAVGLPPGCIGNSEVGHLHIGAGRTILMEMQRINSALANDEFGTMPNLLKFKDTIGQSGGTVHLIGLVSDAGVHALTSHIVEAARTISSFGLPVVVHALTDGRDTPPGTALEMIGSLERRLPPTCNIATVSGRYYAMDRDRRWERVQKAWKTIALGQGERSISAREAVLQATERGETDEFILPTAIGDYLGAKDNDGVFVVNFRSDRVRQILAALAAPDFDKFDISMRPRFKSILGMGKYFAPTRSWLSALFEKPTIVNTLGEWVAKNNGTQIRLAETEKYPHVTFFLNGGKELQEKGEDRWMAQSPKVATYDMKPEMSAHQVTLELIKSIRKGYNLIVANFANPDMVGHTGNLGAAISACEAVDVCLGKVLEVVTESNGVAIVTADHGNCEMMIDPESGGPHTAHTTNPVPIALFGAKKGLLLRSGTLADVAPTLLELMGLPAPAEMTGTSLITAGEN